jgi:hypothetical protein
VEGYQDQGVYASEFRGQGLGSMVWGLGLEVWGVGLRNLGFRFRVEGVDKEFKI